MISRSHTAWTVSAVVLALMVATAFALSSRQRTPIRCEVTGLVRNENGDTELVFRLTNPTRRTWRVPQHSGSMGDFSPGRAWLEGVDGKTRTNDMSFASRSNTGFLIRPGKSADFGGVVDGGVARAKVSIGVFQLDEPGRLRFWVANHFPKLGDRVRELLVWPPAMVDSGGMAALNKP